MGFYIINYDKNPIIFSLNNFKKLIQSYFYITILNYNRYKNYNYTIYNPNNSVK